jgi:Holliday junction resolvasome RuvABC ATP-dependent DNA helicase subunit
LHRNRFGKQINKDTYSSKEIEKASDMRNRDAETRLRERVCSKIKKKSRGTLERCRDLSKIRK